MPLKPKTNPADVDEISEQMPIHDIGKTSSVLPMARRFGWGLADQALSSLTNLALGLVLARSVGAEDFGAFGIIFATYLLILGISRALCTDPLGIRVSAVSKSDWRDGVKSATGATVSLSLFVGAVFVLISGWLSPHLQSGFLALGLGLFGLLLQDSWRFAFFAAGRGVQAFLNDLVWVGALAVGISIILLLELQSVFSMTLVWAGAATVAGLVGAFQAGIIPDPRRTLGWLKRHRDLAAPYVGGFMAGGGLGQLGIYGLGLVVGLEVVGAIRGAVILVGPANILIAGVTLAAVPEGAKILKKSLKRFKSTSVFISLGISVSVLLWGVILLALPDEVGRALLGDTWRHAQPVVLPQIIAASASGGLVGALTGLRALGAAGRTLRSTLVTSVMTSGVMIGLAAYTKTAQGAAWGVAIATAASAFVWWRSYLKAIGDYRKSGDPEGPQPASDFLARAQTTSG